MTIHLGTPTPTDNDRVCDHNAMLAKRKFPTTPMVKTLLSYTIFYCTIDNFIFMMYEI